MNDIQFLVEQLVRNQKTFQKLLSNRTPKEYKWKQQKEKWCLLEIVCHLCDEEQFDFRTRIQHIFNSPKTEPPSFNPLTWVTAHNYMGQNYDQKIQEFISERESSIEWLQNHSAQNWSATCEIQNLDPRSARFYLTNWVAHDLLHIKQITQLNYDYLTEFSDIPLAYAGVWT